MKEVCRLGSLRGRSGRVGLLGCLLPVWAQVALSVNADLVADVADCVAAQTFCQGSLILLPAVVELGERVGLPEVRCLDSSQRPGRLATTTVGRCGTDSRICARSRTEAAMSKGIVPGPSPSSITG